MTSDRPLLAGAAFGLIGIGVAVTFGAVLPAGPWAFDRALQPLVSVTYPEALTAFFNGLASLPVAAALLIAVATWSWARHHGWLVTASIVGALVEIPTEAIKLAIGRPRPPGAMVEAVGSIASYPSGHTVRALVVAGLIALAVLETRRRHDGWPRAVAVAGIAAVTILVGLARIASGDHWPTDVLGGAILGVAWLGIATTVSTFAARNWSVGGRSTRPSG